ncbi:MAG: hypothetical protein CMJ84_15075 [Planctomycetes bacterium]|jgi:hypothetical protein|nr:hypothetical protein [Planctomycetota bacterium]MDP6410204.1 hypothetical protein [Planctomycetota bacterium]
MNEVRETTLTPGPWRASRELSNGLLTTAGLGASLFLVGVMLQPERAWGGYLMGFIYFVGLALAGPLFLSIVYLCGASWARPLRRIPEAMSAALPVAFVLGLGLIVGTHELYEWSHAQVVEEDLLLSHKAAYLNVGGFSVRLIIYFVIWIWVGRKVVGLSTSRTPQPQGRRRSIAISALFMAVLSVTLSLASIDWVQSLDPHWFSTMFALRILSGFGCAGMALCTLVLTVLRRRGPMRAVVTAERMDDLGKILLSLALFWAYIWYCEYMIIWYTDIPEETGYYLLRRQGDWGTLLPVNLTVNFAVPFLVLMPRPWRRSSVILTRVAVLILVGHALDLFVMIAPPILGSDVRLGLWELGPLVGALALFGWILLRALGRAPLVPSESPAAP